MRVLIIGGSGFLGIHLAEELAKKGYMINILDIKKPKNLNKNVKFFNGDITKSKSLIRALKNCKIVFIWEVFQISNTQLIIHIKQ